MTNDTTTLPVLYVQSRADSVTAVRSKAFDSYFKEAREANKTSQQKVRHSRTSPPIPVSLPIPIYHGRSHTCWATAST